MPFRFGRRHFMDLQMVGKIGWLSWEWLRCWWQWRRLLAVFIPVELDIGAKLGDCFSKKILSKQFLFNKHTQLFKIRKQGKGKRSHYRFATREGKMRTRFRFAGGQPRFGRFLA